MELPVFKNSYEIAGRDLLPHREPFLFVDVLHTADETGATGSYTFTAEKNDFFKGHFPGYPVVPGVVLIEAMSQVAGASVVARGILGDDASFAFATVESARFRRPVRPGDTLVTVVNILRERVPLGCYAVKGYVDGELAAEASVKCMLLNRTAKTS